MRQARSQEAERALEAAKCLQRGEPAGLPSDLNTREAIDRELQRVLPGHDPLWPRWVVQREAGA